MVCATDLTLRTAPLKGRNEDHSLLPRDYSEPFYCKELPKLLCQENRNHSILHGTHVTALLLGYQ